MGKIHKERFVFVLLDEFQHFIAETIGQVLPFWPFRQSCNVIWSEIGGWVGRRRSSDVGVKAMFVGIVLFAPQMPLADASCRVTAGMEGIRDRFFFERKIFCPIRHQQLGVFRRQTRNPIRDMESRGIFAGHNRGARWRANGARGIRLRELHSIVSQFVDIWGLV